MPIAKERESFDYKSDLTTEIVNVDLIKPWEGILWRICLNKEDVVTVYLLDFIEEYKITIDGEIKSRGVYDIMKV
jgi:hypothetical protein